MAAVYDVYTDLDQKTITEIAFRVMAIWIEFALGNKELNGHRVMHPTGKLASAVRVEGRGTNHVAVVIDESIAPEATYLEEGHGPIDMKDYLQPGKFYPLHRGVGYGQPILNQTFAGKTNNVWAQPRAQGYSGGAHTPKHGAGVARTLNRGTSKADAWVIPAMPAWSPVSYLADMIKSGAFRQ